MASIPAADLITRTRDLCHEWDQNFWTDAKIYTLLNDAQQEWAETTRCLWRYATDTSETSKQEYALLVDFFPGTIISVTYDSGTGGGKPLTPLRWFKEVYDQSTTWNTTEGLPQYYYIRQNLLGLVPIPSSDYNGNTIRVDGKVEPSTIDSSTCANIDDVHQRYLLRYPASIIAEQNEEFRLAGRLMAEYRRGMAIAKTLYQNVTPEHRLQMAPPVSIGD